MEPLTTIFAFIGFAVVLSGLMYWVNRGDDGDEHA